MKVKDLIGLLKKAPQDDMVLVKFYPKDMDFIIDNVSVYKGTLRGKTTIDLNPDDVEDTYYCGTNVYEKQTFDYERFYKWARDQDNIFISEYSMPDDFVCVWAKEKPVLANQFGADGKALEKLYTTKHNKNKPITFFEF